MDHGSNSSGHTQTPDPFFVNRNVDDGYSNHISACLLELSQSQPYERISGRS